MILKILTTKNKKLEKKLPIWTQIQVGCKVAKHYGLLTVSWCLPTKFSMHKRKHTKTHKRLRTYLKEGPKMS